MSNSYLQGKSYTRQTLVNINHERLCNAHPLSNGWEYAGKTKSGIAIYQKSGCYLTRHPAKDCWLLFWMDCWQPVDLHISELSENLESLKLAIESEIAKEEFAADIETMAA